MASLVNSYFDHSNTLEQSLFNGLKTESIQVQGRTYYYIPRNIVTEDPILGEDVLSKFSDAIQIEMYMENATGFEGDREMFSKFGLQISNSYTLIVSQDRWHTEIGNHFNGTVGTSQIAYTHLDRPQEGDLIYDSLTKFLMEIKFVDNDAEFFQVGKNYLYHLNCEAFQYQSETINTGIAEIDAFNNETLDIAANKLVLEDLSGSLLTQDPLGCFLLLDIAVDPDQVHHQQITSDFSEVATAIQYTVNNPFE